MYIYKIIRDAKMLSGYVTEEYSYKYLSHDILYSEEEFNTMVLDCYNTSTYHNPQNSICISRELIRRYGFRELKTHVLCRYESNMDGIHIKGDDISC